MHELVAFLGHEPTIYHGGLIEHQQNQAMVRLLEIPLRRILLDWELDDVLNEAECIITVDFHQPGANNILPADCVRTSSSIIIHLRRTSLQMLRFFDQNILQHLRLSPIFS